MSKLKMSSWCIFFTWLEPSDLGSMELDTQNYDNHTRCLKKLIKVYNFIRMDTSYSNCLWFYFYICYEDYYYSIFINNKREIFPKQTENATA